MAEQAGPGRQYVNSRSLLGGGLVALLAGLAAVVALTSCFGAGFVWSGPEPTPTPTGTPTLSPTDTSTPTETPTITPTPTITLSPTITPTPTNTVTPGPSPTPTPLPPPDPPLIAPLPEGNTEEHWIDVDISELTATAMLGPRPWYTALVTTGRDGHNTPEGQFRISRRVINETMSGGSLGAESYYYVEDVLFTQYFTGRGHAIHLNYWRPDSVFGNERTSHGCVGMRYEDARFFWYFARQGTRVVIHQ